VTVRAPCRWRWTGRRLNIGEYDAWPQAVVVRQEASASGRESDGGVLRRAVRRPLARAALPIDPP
jgi:hypothetical protein